MPIDRTRDAEVEWLKGIGATEYEDHREPDGTGWVTVADSEGNLADQARREWLDLRDGELPPKVIEAVFPSLVVWASLWPDRPDDQIRFDIEDQRLTWTLLGDASDDDQERLGQLRYRLNVMINKDLRISFGQ